MKKLFDGKRIGRTVEPSLRNFIEICDRNNFGGLARRAGPQKHRTL